MATHVVKNSVDFAGLPLCTKCAVYFTELHKQKEGTSKT